MPEPDRKSNAPSHVQVKKKHMITIIGGAITMIVGAATPGILSWIDGAGERADHSQEVAQHASVKSDIAYEQVWTQMQFLQDRLRDNKGDMRSLTQRIDMLVMLYQSEKPGIMPVMEAHRGRPVARAARSEVDDLLGVEVSSESGSGAVLVDLDGGVDSDSLEKPFEAVAYPTKAPPMQQMVRPENLNKMAKQHIEQSKEAK